MIPDFGSWQPRRVLRDTIVCWFCKRDTGIGRVLMMVIPSEGLKCPHCGSVVATGSKVWM
jgi:hypothetical protein